ncbi:hypothetical protein QOZ80_9BG0711960 [Eleusine coracana subsp. coracana]|nr:hypothetical protein QOZ80_9BG0711960 [Eleusine coracana subsp. coracana]
MLSSKRGVESTHTYWSKVYQSMGSGLKDNPDLIKMRKILSVSYLDLPAHLKNRLLFLSSYLEDDLISVKELIWNWVAQGFVYKEDGRSLYKVGEDYVAQLINRNFIQAKLSTGRQETRLCTVHDMILDLVVYLAQEENFLITLGGLPMPDKVHRLVIRCSTHGNIKKFATMNLMNLRSLVVYEEAFHFLPELSSFPMLRSLDLSYCMQVDNRAFRVICDLFHLRCLRLFRTSITKVPKEISNLCFLQILDIGANIFIDTQLPLTFIYLRQLIFLQVPYETKLPDGFENLESLEELGSVLVRSAGMLENLGKLTELRALSIVFETWNDVYVEPLRRCLCNLSCLESLDLDLQGSIDLIWRETSPMLEQLHTLSLSAVSGIAAAPSWLASIYSLSELNISLQTLGEVDIQVLGDIPSLRLLGIYVDKSTHGRDRKLVIEKNKFRCLKRLDVYSPSLDIVFAPGALEKLEDLSLWFGLDETMVQFGGMEFGIENLSSLLEVHIKFWTWNSSMPDFVRAAEDTIRGAISMNPNEPQLNLQVIKRN